MSASGLFGGINVRADHFPESVTLGFLSKINDNIILGKRYINKFVDERFCYENEDFLILFDGFIFNTPSGQTQENFIVSLFYDVGVLECLKTIDGVFSIVIYSKKDRKIKIATDHLASRKIFYFKNQDHFIFSSDLKDVSRFSKELEQLEISRDSIYGFLGFGSYISNTTPFKNIFKIEPLSLLTIDINSMDINIEKYENYEFKKLEYSDVGQIVDRFEDLIQEPLEKICELNNKYNYDQVSTLSGGLDSKTIFVLLSEKFARVTSFTFAEYGSLDQSIAQKVANDFGSSHVYVALNNGNCLIENFDEVIKLTGGCISMHTILHAYFATKKLDCSRFGLMFTGQIGDAIFGSHFIGKKTIKEFISSKSHYGKIPDFILNKIDFFDEFISKYDKSNVEAYIYEGRISCGAIYGDIVAASHVDCITPFYSKNLLKYAISVADKFRSDDVIYLAWLKKWHSNILNYKIDKSNCRPSSPIKVKIFTFINYVLNGIRKKFKLDYTGMNPFDKWYRRNPQILHHFDAVYSQLINNTVLDDELIKDIKHLYISDVDLYKRNRFVVVTLLLTLDYHLND